MTIDIIFSGLFSNIIIKQKSKRYFCSSKYICRNDVFVDTQKDNTYHIKKNAIHISVSSDNESNIKDISESFKHILNGRFIGIKTTDSIYKLISKSKNLNMLRM